MSELPETFNLPKEALYLWAMWLEGEIEIQINSPTDISTACLLMDLEECRENWRKQRNNDDEKTNDL